MQISKRVFCFLGLLLMFPIFLRAQLPDLKFDHITSENGLPQSTIHGIVKDKYGFMWFGTWDGLCRYDGYNFKIYYFDPNNKKSIINNRIHNLLKDDNGDLWILTFDRNFLCKYNYEHDNFDRVNVNNVSKNFLKLINRWNHYSSISYSYKGYTWSLNREKNALLQQNNTSDKKKFYTYNAANKWSISDAYAVDIYKDNQNIFWVGTYTNGINKANLNAKPFNYYYHDPLNPNSITDNNVRALCEDNLGNLWVGTYDKGITIIDKNGLCTRMVFKDADEFSFTHNQVKTIFCDSRGIIWIGTKKGLLNYNPATRKYKYFPEFNDLRSSTYGIMEDDQHNIWIACFYQGIYKYLAKEDRLVHYDPTKTLNFNNARVIIEDNKHQIWVGTEGAGISVLKKGNQKDSLVLVKRFSREENTKQTNISDNRINSIYEDQDGFIWIGTGNGLDRYNPKTEKIENISSRVGLTNVNVSGILTDTHGNLWLSHKKGITKIRRGTLDTRNYTAQDGLQSNEFSDGTVSKSNLHNRLYFGGSEGVNFFNPDSVLIDHTLPVTVITDLEILNKKVAVNQKVNGRIVLKKPLYLTKEIVLTYDDKSIAFEFSALHYANPQGNKYAYMLEGVDDEWVYSNSNRRIASYSNLKPGKYIFKVISSNSDGIWNTKPTKLNITVEPPFWASTLAYFLYIIAFLAALYAYFYYSTRYARLKSKLQYEALIREKENELHQNKLQFYTNISHEIKTPLTLILAPLQKLIYHLKGDTGTEFELKTMKSNGDRLLKLVNELLDFRRLETGNTLLNLRKNDIVSHLERIISAFKPLAETKNIYLQLNHHFDHYYFSYDEDKIEKVLANLLSNALKFTYNDGLIKVILKEQESINGKCVIIEVINEGIGIEEENAKNIFSPFQQASTKQAGSGLGLAFSKGLVELHHGKISFSSVKIKDNLFETTFKIELPIATSGDLSLPEDESEKTNTLNEPTEVPNMETAILTDIPLSSGLKGNILIVEDNPELRNYLKHHLQNNYHVIDAPNGKKGFEMALDSLPDLILSDVMMEEMDGFTLLQKLKADSRTAYIPVVLLTAKAQEENKIEGIETGADDYITKPFNLDYLDARIKNLLLSRQLLKDKYRRNNMVNIVDNIPLSHDEKILQKFSKYVEDHLSDVKLNVDDICAHIGVGRTQLYTKLKSLTGLGIAEIIKETRLKRAKILLQDKKFNISEVTFMVGFSDPDYFRKCFKAEFGINPSELSKNH